MHKILVVGQTPPPYGGQSIMIEKILRHNYSHLKLVHVRLAFSKEMNDIGRFQIMKLLHLATTVLKIWWAWVKHRPHTLYYPPAGPDRIPMYRDFFILVCVRWLFKKTVFHFHAGGVTERYADLSKIERFLFRLAYNEPDGSILLSKLNPRDDINLNSKRNYEIPYGIEDLANNIKRCSSVSVPNILYVGILKESKGVLTLINAFDILSKRGVKFRATLVGKFESREFGEIVKNLVSSKNLSEKITFTGVLTGEDKWREYHNASIFCYPTFFESETFGLVVLEAMQFELPAVVSRWRGVPSLVDEGKTGFVVPPRDEQKFADRLELLCLNSNLTKQMGENARQRFLEKYSSEAFQSKIETALLEVAQSK